MITPEDSKKLTVIVVSYNTRELTLRCLDTLSEDSNYDSYDVVVFDNDSNDGSADAVQHHHPDVTLVRSDENLGFAAANNIVAESARTPWLLLLNPDTEVYDSAVSKLLQFAETHPDAGIYGGRTVFPDGSLNKSSCWNRITLWSLFCAAFGLTTLWPNSSLFHPEAIGGWPRDSVRYVDIVVGCFLLIRKETWDRLSGFDLRYFMYGEEADLCLRARALGCKPIICPDATIMHLVGASSSTIASKVLLVAKARCTLIRTHWSSATVPLGVFLMKMWALNRWIASEALYLVRKGSPSARTSAEKWRGIWQQRADWLGGY